MKRYFLSLVLVVATASACVPAVAASAPSASAQAVPGARTDINPALLYWQAMSLIPALSDADHDYVFTNDWRGRALDGRFEELIRKFDSAFRVLNQAAAQRVPCDWGYDFSKGPELELPGLAKAKSLAQAARLRTHWHLEHGRQDAAREELVASLAMARQLSRDGVLISTLVQLAIENILTSGIAENWHRFEPGTLDAVLVGLNSAPQRGSVAQCVSMERTVFPIWMALRIREFRKSSASEAEALRKAVEMVTGLEPGIPDLSDRVVSASGGTVEGMLRLLGEIDPWYDELATLMTTPYPAVGPAVKAFDTRVAGHTNAFVQVFLGPFGKCRIKELAAESRLAMVGAAVEYRRSGESGLARVKDPVTREPFGFRRFVFDGVDYGFELRSKAALREWPEVQIFVEKEGPPCYLDGPKAGQAIKP